MPSLHCINLRSPCWWSWIDHSVSFFVLIQPASSVACSTIPLGNHSLNYFPHCSHFTWKFRRISSNWCNIISFSSLKNDYCLSYLSLSFYGLSSFLADLASHIICPLRLCMYFKWFSFCYDNHWICSCKWIAHDKCLCLVMHWCFSFPVEKDNTCLFMWETSS